MEVYFSAHPLKPFIPTQGNMPLYYLFCWWESFLYQYQDVLRQNEWNITVRYAIAFLFIGVKLDFICGSGKQGFLS